MGIIEKCEKSLVVCVCDLCWTLVAESFRCGYGRGLEKMMGFFFLCTFSFFFSKCQSLGSSPKVLS